MNKPYFHALTDEEFKRAIAEHKKYKDFQQPPWCGYPDALHWLSGCWVLTERKVKCEADCLNCECFIKK